MTTIELVISLISVVLAYFVGWLEGRKSMEREHKREIRWQAIKEKAHLEADRSMELFRATGEEEWAYDKEKRDE